MIETIIIAGAIVLDQLTKWWARTTLKFAAGSIPLIPGIVELRYVENRGAAFSIFWGKTGFFIVIGVVVVSLLGFYLIRYRAQESLWTRIAIASVIGGAVGNLLDRIFFGYVVDMFNPVFIRFAVFNVADIFLTCGAILLIFLLAIWPMLRKKKIDAA